MDEYRNALIGTNRRYNLFISEIDSTITKCCSACFNRIVRRMGSSVDSNSASTNTSSTNVSATNATTPSTASTTSGADQRIETTKTQAPHLLRWTEEETEALKKGLRTYGTRWSEICQLVGPTKSQHQCKNFYFNYRKKLGLDQLLQKSKVIFPCIYRKCTRPLSLET